MIGGQRNTLINVITGRAAFKRVFADESSASMSSYKLVSPDAAHLFIRSHAAMIVVPVDKSHCAVMISISHLVFQG